MQMCSGMVHGESSRAFPQEPALASSSDEGISGNSTVVVNTASSQNSLNASGIASLFSSAKFENSTVNINFTTASKSSFNSTFDLNYLVLRPASDILPYFFHETDASFPSS